MMLELLKCLLREEINKCCVKNVGGSTVSVGPNGIDTYTLYPNGSNYQRHNLQEHRKNLTTHGYGHLMGTGPNRRGQGDSIDVFGNVVPFDSPETHWPIK